MKKNFLFLSFAIPHKEMKAVFKRDRFPMVQTHKFNWNFIKGIECCNAFDCTYISARPVADYPLFPEKNIEKNDWRVGLIEKEIEITEIPFSNGSLLKIITRFLSSIYYGIKKYRKCKNKAGVIVYSTHVPFMMTGYIISKLYGVDYIAIWTDPPSMPYESEPFLKSKLRGFELLVSKYLMKKADRVVALTKYLAEDFAPGKPYIVIEGIIDTEDINSGNSERSEREDDDIVVVYTGSLEERYGIKNIVDAFISMNGENTVFEIYGRGDYEEDLKRVCAENKNIRYRGFVPNAEVMEVQRKADFVINARSPEEEYVKYSFPSKTLEYMLSGTPLITTMLPGIPDEYGEYVLVLENNSPETISEMLRDIAGLSEDKRAQLGRKALDFARTKSYSEQGKSIVKFLEMDEL